MKPHALIVLFLLVSLVSAQEAQPNVVAAWKDTVRDEFVRKGTFIPAEASEISLDLQVYRGELILEEVLSHGRLVNKGDVIARFRMKWIDEQLRGDEMSVKRTEMDLLHAQEKARMQAQSAAAALERSERDAGRAAKRLKGYREHEKGFEDENERLSVQIREHRLDDQSDELKQLEKMYSEDELVDATEEIVLKRQRRNFARSQSSFDLSERRRKHRKEYYEVWREEDLEMDARHKAEALERTRRSQALDREKTESDLAKRSYEVEKARTRLADLRGDRGQLVVRAPQAGLLLHGAADDAPWSSHLERGHKAKNRSVLMTVADPKQLKVVTTIDEPGILKVQRETAVEVEPSALEDLKLPGRLVVEYLPGKGGNFDAHGRACTPRCASFSRRRGTPS
jgi:hypothetical protein